MLFCDVGNGALVTLPYSSLLGPSIGSSATVTSGVGGAELSCAAEDIRSVGASLCSVS